MKKEPLSILYPRQSQVQYRELPEGAWHDLGLDALAESIAKQPQEVPLIERVMSHLTDDPQVSTFRAEVFADFLRFPAIRDRLMKLLEQVKTFYDYGIVNRGIGDEAGLWDLLHRLEEYHHYILTVEAIRECLSDQDIASGGLCALRDEVERIYTDNGFAALKRDVEEMRLSASEVRSMTVGINLNERFEAISLGLIAVNKKPFKSSSLLKHFVNAISLRDDLRGEAEWDQSMSFYPAEPAGAMQGVTNFAESVIRARNPLLALSMARIPDQDGSAGVPRQMDSAASMLATRITRRLKEMLGQYLNVSVREMADLIPELLFYTRWAEYIEKRRAEGWTFCQPRVRQETGKAPGMRARGFYNLKLIGAIAPVQAVRNDLVFDDRARVYLLTGANRGGKTTVTQAVGQLFLLAQSGISVPAEEFEFDPVDGVLTHFPADEDRTMNLGRLGEECQRFRQLYQASTGKSLLLLNETFSTTSFEEGYYIAVDAVKAILRRGTRTIYNTHMHKLAQELDMMINSPDSEGRAVSLVVESRAGERTFRIRVGPPEGKSFAREIAEKYGVTYEALVQPKEPLSGRRAAETEGST